MTSATGNITINGTGSGTGSDNHGVYVLSSGTNGGVISSTGTGANAAIINITGQGSLNATGNNNDGVRVEGTNSKISSIDGNITLTGTGGGTGTTQLGVRIVFGGQVQSTGNATITVNGFGSSTGNGVNYGVQVFGSNSAIASVNGNITVNGTGNGSGTTNHGLTVEATGVIKSTGIGTVNLTGIGSGTSSDGIRIDGIGSKVQSNSGVINLTGTGSGTGFGINLINSGAITSTTGTINLLASTINLANTASITTASDVFINQDNDVPIGITTLGATVNVTAGNLYLNDTIKVDYNSSLSRFDTINLTGAVDLAGSTLDLDLTGYTAPAANTFYTLINNDGTDAVTGTFTGIAEGAQLGLVGSYGIFITYKGDATNPSLGNIGSGNDVQLYAVNRPPTDLILSNNNINENVAANSLIGTFSSTDLEVGSTFTYSFVNGTNDNNAFTINGNQLLINASPNFEAKSSYSILVRTSDQGGLSYDKALTITINNVNEAPTITSIGTANFAENGTGTVYTVIASDPDAGATLAYSITGTDAARFNIDSNTGTITFKTSPDFEAPSDSGTNNIYDLNVTASDGSLSATQAVTISVTDVNEPPNATGDANANLFTGTSANNNFFGLGGNDTLLGYGGNDALSGGEGDDLIDGGAGADRMLGGTGADTFRYTAFSDSLFAASDTIVSFNQTEGDRLQIIPATIGSARNLGTRTGASLSAVANTAGASLSGVNGFDAVFFQYASRNYLIVDNGNNAYNSAEDLFVTTQAFTFKPGNTAANSTLTVSDYFAPAP